MFFLMYQDEVYYYSSIELNVVLNTRIVLLNLNVFNKLQPIMWFHFTNLSEEKLKKNNLYNFLLCISGPCPPCPKIVKSTCHCTVADKAVLNLVMKDPACLVQFATQLCKETVIKDCAHPTSHYQEVRQIYAMYILLEYQAY